MKVDFEKIAINCVANLNGGNGSVGAKMHFDNGFKIMESVIPAGSSIGSHTHNASIDFNYVISGECVAVCDGAKEFLKKGDVHYCPSGSTHSIENIGEKELVLLTIVTELI